MTRCYVPVVGYVPGIRLNPLLGYERWIENENRTPPYIFPTTLEEYYEQTASTLGGMHGMVFDQYLHVPPKSLYPSADDAYAALVLHTPVRTLTELSRR